MFGYEWVWYWENIDGGYGSVDDFECVEVDVVEFGFLWVYFGLVFVWC